MMELMNKANKSRGLLGLAMALALIGMTMVALAANAYVGADQLPLTGAYEQGILESLATFGGSLLVVAVGLFVFVAG